eukprot:1188381-Rhodomonas_salina.1
MSTCLAERLTVAAPCSQASCSSGVTTPQWSEKASMGQITFSHCVKSLNMTRTASSCVSSYKVVLTHSVEIGPARPTTSCGRRLHAACGT